MNNLCLRHGFNGQARQPARRGVVLAIVLGTMVVATILVAMWAQTVVRAHRQQRVVERQLQTSWLVEAGIERAVARLSVSDDYPGETWQLPAHELGGPYGAAVAIHVELVEGAAEHRLLRVQANYPEDPVRRIRRSKQITVDLAQLRGS